MLATIFVYAKGQLKLIITYNTAKNQPIAITTCVRVSNVISVSHVNKIITQRKLVLRSRAWDHISSICDTITKNWERFGIYPERNNHLRFSIGLIQSQMMRKPQEVIFYIKRIRRWDDSYDRIMLSIPICTCMPQTRKWLTILRLQNSYVMYFKLQTFWSIVGFLTIWLPSFFYHRNFHSQIKFYRRKQMRVSLLLLFKQRIWTIINV